MFDFEGREEASYDEVAICISTVVGALSKVTWRLSTENDADTAHTAHTTVQEISLAQTYARRCLPVSTTCLANDVVAVEYFTTSVMFTSKYRFFPVLPSCASTHNEQSWS